MKNTEIKKVILLLEKYQEIQRQIISVENVMTAKERSNVSCNMKFYIPDDYKGIAEFDVQLKDMKIIVQLKECYQIQLLEVKRQLEMLGVTIDKINKYICKYIMQKLE